MSPQDIQEGGVYERDREILAPLRREVLRIDQGPSRENALVTYIDVCRRNSDKDIGFCKLQEFARWADRRAV